jgi:hypothetical protein
MSLEKIDDLLLAYREITGPNRPKKLIVVIQGAEPLHFSIYLPKQISNMYLADFIFSLCFEFTLQLDHILKKFTKFDSRLLPHPKTQTQFVAYLAAVTDLAVDIVCELWIAWLDQIEVIGVPHLRTATLSCDSHQDVLVREKCIEMFA